MYWQNCATAKRKADNILVDFTDCLQIFRLVIPCLYEVERIMRDKCNLWVDIIMKNDFFDSFKSGADKTRIANINLSCWQIALKPLKWFSTFFDISIFWLLMLKHTLALAVIYALNDHLAFIVLHQWLILLSVLQCQLQILELVLFHQCLSVFINHFHIVFQLVHLTSRWNFNFLLLIFYLV